MTAIEGCVITIDAMGCQYAIADTIIKKRADYVLSLKENQPELHNSLLRADYYTRP